ncbi:hypothetical protein SCOCK_20348 [Actinacidiphila cocklensis]|uniref:Uncharacterized protein n=1 Tax=Actinacidiphila cocklensis TaxID=887465 RepID=A0A9W4DKY2_9ACTN|nr:hypothetical protein SCOCK_20348 [Actinacidiphila cocklensis]
MNRRQQATGAGLGAGSEWVGTSAVPGAGAGGGAPGLPPSRPPPRNGRPPTAGRGRFGGVPAGMRAAPAGTFGKSSGAQAEEIPPERHRPTHRRHPHTTTHPHGWAGGQAKAHLP